MTKLVSLLTVSAALAAAPGCSSRAPAGGTAAQAMKACTPEAECSACASCFDACICGGGAATRCTETCAVAPPSASHDAGASHPVADAGPPRPEMPATFIADAFDIPPGGEMFRCQNFDNPYRRDVAVLSSEAFMTVGSHHMFLFLEQTPGALGPLFECSGLSFGTSIHTAQKSESRIDYPPGVGMIVPGTNGFQIMVHYLNTSTELIHAVVAVTLHATDPSNVRIHASQIFANTISVNIPARSKGTVKHSCGIPTDVNLFTAVSHMHSHGVHYVARSSDGQLLYETKDWAEPEPWRFTPPRLLRAGSTIDITCDYDNQTDQDLTFGESAATNEMCIFVGGYYPAMDGQSITCLF